MDARLKEWCDAASSKIRFAHDREAVRRELADHLEDHCDALAELGYDPDLAAERTLAAMGDAEEVGKALDRQHSPLLGWAWLLSRAALVGLLFAMLVELVTNGYAIGQHIQETLMPTDLAEEKAGLDENHVWHGNYRTCLGVSYDSDSAESCGLEIAVSKAVWWKIYDQYKVDLLVTVTPKYPWYSGACEIWDDLKYSDSTQQPITNMARDYIGGNMPASLAISGTEHPPQSIWKKRFLVTYTLETLPEWVAFSYPYGDNDWTIRVEREETK